MFRRKYDFRAVQRSAFCRSRRELSNAYFLAKFRFDTAENEPAKNLQNFAKLKNIFFANFANDPCLARSGLSLAIVGGPGCSSRRPARAGRAPGGSGRSSRATRCPARPRSPRPWRERER